jgi:dihydropteroate synthase type 2
VIARPGLLGILNITEDSFSDGGRYLAPDAAIARARELGGDGAAIIDIGAASSNPNAKTVAPDVEIARMAPVIDALKRDGVAVSVDSFAVPVQRWALGQRVDYLNDIHGFPHPELYDELAASDAKLIVMHAIQAEGPADRTRVDPAEIFDRVMQFFDRRVAALEGAGIARGRLILDPGMGFFLGTAVEASYTVLRQLPALKQAFALPVLISVSRKSFLRKLTGRSPQASGAATLSAELFAVGQGADYIRTHDPGALKDALLIQDALRGPAAMA